MKEKKQNPQVQFEIKPFRKTTGKKLDPKSDQAKNIYTGISKQGGTLVKNDKKVQGKKCICSSNKKKKKKHNFLSNLEEYDCTNLPFLVKNKYLQLLKVHKFPFKKLGKFKASAPKRSKKTTKTPKLVHEAINEANELFTKMGYEGQLVNWLDRVCIASPKPLNPHEYLKSLFVSEGVKVDSEYLTFLEKLKKVLAFENELQFELAQIQLLIGMIDEKHYGYNGKTREVWDSQIILAKEMRDQHRIKRMLKKLTKINCQIKKEKKLAALRNVIDPQQRVQIIEDLKLWKKYKPPTMEPFIRDTKMEPDDGRIRDWFQCLEVPMIEGVISQAPVHEIDDEEAVRLPSDNIDQSISSSCLNEDYN